MKTKFDSKELPHTWVHKQAARGTCAQAMSFDGDSFFSYSLKIGKRITRKGRTAYLLKHTGCSSVTTSKHQNSLAAAIPDSETVFYCSGELDGVTGGKLFRQSLDLAGESALAAEKAVSRGAFHLSEQARWIRQAESAAKFWGLSSKVPNSAALLEKIKNAEATEAKRKAAANRKAELAAKEIIAQWLAGEQVSIPCLVGTVYLRAIVFEADNRHENSRMMETSKGARIPLAEAEKAYRFACLMRARGWHRNGDQFKVGDYQLDAVNVQGVIAGCHRVAWDEIERFAATQGWTAQTAAA